MNSMRIKKNKTIFNVFASTFTIFILFLLWILISSTKNNSLIYPTIDEIFKEFGNIFKITSLKIFGYSFYRLLISVVISFAISFVVMMLYICRKWTFGFISPLIKIMRSVPFVSFSIFVILIFGNKNSPYIITGLVIIPIIVDGLRGGLDQIDRNLTDDLSLLNIGFFKKMYLVYIPILLPTIITLLLQTFGLGFKVMVMGEYFAQTSMSVGKELYNAQSFLDMDVVIAWTIMIVLITGIVEFFVNLVKEKYNYIIK